MAKKKHTKQDDNFILPQALMDYLNRIGAEVLSFRRAMVKERSKGDKYYVERTLIKIAANGEITCSRKEHNPTTEEEEAIVAAFKNLKFPTSVNGTIQGAKKHIRDMEGDPDRFFILPDRQSGDVRMLQERIETKDGRKGYVPWSFWSDSRWRRMEPDGNLPFWKPLSRSEGRTRIMVHEGCKAARAVHDLTTNPDKKKELAKHPWGEELCNYEHWGMIGGALAPHRTDYDEIRREKPHQVVYVCDNDYEGKSVLQEVSKHYGQALTGIMFDNSFPPSWDMADPIPKIMFKGSRYIGRSLREMMKPATYATELIASGNKGKPATVIRRAFKEEWVHSVKPEVFIHVGWPSRLLMPREFNNTVRPFSHVDDTGRLLLQDESNKTAVLKYDPSHSPGIYASRQGHFINTHVPTLIKAEKGGVKPFLEFMENLVPIECDRNELLRWCATLIARPDIKMHYGVLLISETQGVGKGTLGAEILAPLMGEENVSFPTEDDICKNMFNYWCTHKRLAVVHEIYAGHSATAYNKLKSIITDHNITAQRKYMTPYDLENWLHVFACSNSRRAIQLSSDDRRWFVPKITEEKQPGEYWKTFHDWLRHEGGLNKIKQWAHDWLETNPPVETGDPAPWSIAKGEVVEEGYSPGMTLVARLFDSISEELDKKPNERTVITNGSKFRSQQIDDDCIILDTDLIEMIKKHIHDGRQSDKLEKPLTVRKVAKQKGWVQNDNRISSCAEWNLKATGSKLVCKKSDTARYPISSITGNGQKPFDVIAYMGSKI